MERNERPQRMLARMAELFDLTDSEVRIFGKIDAVEYVR